MKKIFILIFIIILVITSIACSTSNSGQGKQVLVARREKNNRSIEREYTATNDIVTNVKQTTILDMIALEKQLQEVLRQSTMQAKIVYESTDGVIYEIIDEEDVFTEIITIDFTKNNLSEIQDLDLIDITVKDGKISLKQTQILLSENGWLIE